MIFKIYSLTPHIEEEIVKYTADIITNFSDQFSSFKEKQKESFLLTYHSYTFDETYKEDLNSKKTLNFSMSKKVFIDGEYITNPFVNNIQVNSLILLIDMYNNHTFFVITDIDYSFSANNTIYKYTCEDLFSYTTTRLNSGYTLENDSSSEDFIGAKTIDWWVMNHINPDCKISYSYIPFYKGIYETKNGKIQFLDKNSDGNTNIINLKKIIKEAYPDATLSAEIRSKVETNTALTAEEQATYDSYLKNHTFYEEYSFSCSNSSANGALVSLADHYDLQIRVFEQLNFKTGEALFYFWFEPKKNDKRVTGLQYSPKNGIQNFSLGHSGKSLTTILNVQGPTYDDEIISLIPPVSPFFYQLFQSSLWEQSIFSSGSYSSFLAPQTYVGYMLEETAGIETTEGYAKDNPTVKGNFVYELSSIESIKNFVQAQIEKDYLTTIPESEKTFILNQIEKNIKEASGVENTNQCIICKLSDLPIWLDGLAILPLYPNYDFGNSIISYRTKEGEKEVIKETAPYTHKWKLLLHTLTTKAPSNEYISSKNKPEDTWVAYENGAMLPVLAQDKITSNPSSHVLNEYYLIIDIQEEKQSLNQKFNNFILNFSRQITATDYEFARAADKCPWLENKLIDTSYFRNYNLISKDEYRTLNTLIYDDLRKINGKLLCYSAAYYNAMHDKTKILANLINNFESMGAACQAAIISPYETTGVVSDYSYFTSAYNQIYTTNNINNTPLFNYYETRTDYFNKYFNAQQRFLRNAYLFKEFWEAPVSVPGEGLYTYQMTIKKPIPPKSANWTLTYYTFANSSAEPKALDEDFINYDNNPSSPTYGEPSTTIYDRQKTNAKTKDKKSVYQYIPTEVVHARNYKKYFINVITPGTLTSSTTFNLLSHYQKRIIKVRIKDTSDQTYPFPIILTRVNNKKEITSTKDKYNGIWLLIEETEIKNISFSVDQYKDKQIYVCDSGSYSVEYNGINASFPELKFAFSRVTAENSNEDYITTNHYLIPVYYDKKKNAFIRVETKNFLYNGIHLNQTNTAISYSYDYLSVSEKEMINNWIETQYFNKTGIDKIYLKNSEFYMPILKLFEGKKHVLEIFKENPNDDDDTMPVPKNVESYMKYFPIDTLYWFGNKSSFNIEKTENSNYTDVFTFYTKDNLVTKIVSEDDKQYLPISLVTEKNVNKFFKRCYKTGGSKTSLFSTDYPGSSFASCVLQNKAANDNNNNTWTTVDDKKIAWDYWGQPLTPAITGFESTAYRFIYSPVMDGEERLLAFQQTQNLTPEKYYSTIYSNLAFTFNCLENICKKEGERDESVLKIPDVLDLRDKIKPADLYIKDAEWTIVKKGDQISQNGSFFLLNVSALMGGDNYIKGDFIQKEIKQGNIFCREKNEEFSYKTSGAVWYPIIDYMQTISFAGLDWNKDTTKTWEKALEEYTKKIGITFSFTDEDGIFFTAALGGVISTFVLCECRDYSLKEIQQLEESEIITLPNYFSSGKFLLTENNLDYNFRQQQRLTLGYFVIAKDAKEYKNPENFDINQAYFKKQNEDYIRVYTIPQAIKFGYYYYFNAFENTQQGFQKKPSELTLILYKHIQNGQTITTEDGQSSYIYSSETVLPEKNIYSIKPNWTENSNQISIKISGISTTIGISVSTNSISFRNMNNGTFWYKFSRNSDYPICLSQAAAIEAQLTQYWSSAYTASKYCEYYLPENWIHYVNNEENKMFNLIFSTQNENLVLTNRFIPNVKIFSRNNETLLDKFRWVYEPYNDNNIISNKNEFNPVLSSEYVNPINIQDNVAIRKALDIIDEDITHFKLEKIGKQTYYYAESGGWYWKDFLLDTIEHTFERYSGLYVMMYKMLGNYQPLTLNEYENTKAAHDQLWTALRKRFGYALLEQSYKNEDATSAEELYNAAKYHFLDLQLPERKYSLTINDLYALKGYEGQELRIGDPIELFAEDFYDKKDLIYKSLKQYLFISNLQYTLRDPTKRSITVNNIRYSDRLINRLAQLLR